MKKFPDVVNTVMNVRLQGLTVASMRMIAF
jgi:hypothetical protein